MAVYNIEYMNNATSVLDLLIGVSGLPTTDYLIGNLMLLSVFVILLAGSLRYDFLEVFITSSIITTILAVFLWSTDLLSATTIVWPAVAGFLALLFLFFTR
jgi:hypothetical protein